jgi:translation initiation factor 2 subunit 2
MIFMTEYETLLDEAYGKVKAIEGNGERFEIPKIEGHFEGKKTILTNFSQITSHLRRSPEQLQKFLLKSLATQGQREGDRLVLNNKIPSTKINPRIEDYVREFVLCRECNKPDTEIIKEGKINLLHCLACGAKHPIRTKV